MPMPRQMPLAARRVFRLAATTALALAGGYALALELPFMAPLFAFILASKPAPPMGVKGLLGLSLLLVLTLGLGVLLTPVLRYYPMTGLMLVLLGLFFANYVALNLGKGPVGTFLTAGIAIISTAGLTSMALATALIQAMVFGVAIGVVSLWLIYPFFPEDGPAPEMPAVAPAQSSWLAVRATLIVFPAFLLVLANTAYLPTVMKAVQLGQQDSVTDAKHAGRELVGSTFMGGLWALMFWLGLSIWPSLWMFTLWMLLVGVYICARVYGVVPSRYPPSYWVNTMVTLLILLGPAVNDSATGKDVMTAFLVRLSLIVAVALYASAAVVLLERWRDRRVARGTRAVMA